MLAFHPPPATRHPPHATRHLPPAPRHRWHDLPRHPTKHPAIPLGPGAGAGPRQVPERRGTSPCALPAVSKAGIAPGQEEAGRNSRAAAPRTRWAHALRGSASGGAGAGACGGGGGRPDADPLGPGWGRGGVHANASRLRSLGARSARAVRRLRTEPRQAPAKGAGVRAGSQPCQRRRAPARRQDGRAV